MANAREWRSVRLVIESKRVRFPLEKVVNELLEEEAAPRDALGLRQLQIPVNLRRTSNNMMPRKKDGRFGLSRVQEIEVMQAHSAAASKFLD